MSSVILRHDLHSNTLLREEVEHELRRPVVLVDVLALLEQLHALHVAVKQVRAVHWATLSLGVELGREDGPGLVHHSLVGSVVEVDEVLLEVRVESAGINGVTVVLARDVALASGQVQGRDVVGTVAVLHLDGARTSCQGQQLVTKANSHDWDGRGLDEAGKVVDGVLAVSWVTRAVGDEDSVEVGRNLVDWEVVRKHRHGRSSADQTSKNVLLDSTVEQSNVEGRVGGGDNERSLGAHFLDEVDLAGVDEALVFVGIVLVANGNPSQGGTTLTEECDDSTGVNARDSRNTLTSTPLSQALDSSPVTVLCSNVGYDNTSALDVGGLEVLQELVLVTDVGGDTVVADQRLGEDQDLATVGGIGHRLGVANQGGGKDGLTRDVRVGTEGSSVEDGTILAEVSTNRLV